MRKRFRATKTTWQRATFSFRHPAHGRTSITFFREEAKIVVRSQRLTKQITLRLDRLPSMSDLPFAAEVYANSFWNSFACAQEKRSAG